MAHARYTNEPAGLSTEYECAFNNTMCGIDENVYNTEAYIIDGTAPYTGPWVFKSYRAAGTAFGNGQWVQHFTPPQREVFLGMDWKTNPEFVGFTNNTNKLIFISAPGGSGDVSFLVWQGPADSSSKELKWYQQGIVNNTHISTVFNTNYPTDGTGWFNPNVNSSVAQVPRGVWTKVEVYLKSSTSATSKDGIIRIWINGTLSSNYTNANISWTGFEFFQINNTWDGGGAITSADWIHYFDHIYISTGAGGFVPPVTPPTISSITPTSGPVGTPITIVGTNFDTVAAANNTVTLNGTACTVLAAVATQINTAVPTGATSGLINVSTSQGSVSSPVSFTVTAADPGGGTGGGTGGGAGATTSVYETDFSGTQGPRWYYLDQNGTQMTYSSGSQLWSGGQLYQGIWQGGCHPGTTGAAVLKYVVPGTGSVHITGTFSDLDTGGGDGVTCTIKKNGSTTVAGPYTIANGNTTGNAYDVTNTVADGDYFTFEVGPGSNNVYDSTTLNPTVVYTPQAQTEPTIVLSLSSVTAQEFLSAAMTLSMTPTRTTETVVLLSSSNGSAIVPVSATIPANTGSVSVQIQAGIPGTAIVTATLGTSTTTSTITSTAAPDVDPGDPDPTPVVSPTISAYTDFLTVYRLF